ncbi:hypothetical protein ACOZB2_18760, partial [Pantoea endophytica]
LKPDRIDSVLLSSNLLNNIDSLSRLQLFQPAIIIFLHQPSELKQPVQGDSKPAGQQPATKTLLE